MLQNCLISSCTTLKMLSVGKMMVNMSISENNFSEPILRACLRSIESMSVAIERSLSRFLRSVRTQPTVAHYYLEPVLSIMCRIFKI